MDVIVLGAALALSFVLCVTMSRAVLDVVLLLMTRRRSSFRQPERRMPRVASTPAPSAQSA
jgi:Flp pilus assembly protein protease CpaA